MSTADPKYIQVIEYFGEDIIPFINDILYNRVGRYNLAKQTGKTKHKCRVAIEMIKMAGFPDGHTPEVDISTDTGTKTNNYEPSIEITATREDGTLMDIDEYCQTYGLNRAQVKSWKLVTHTNKAFYNIAMYDQGEDQPLDEEHIIGLIKSHVKPVKIKFHVLPEQSSDFTRVVFTDVHIGMDPNKRKDAPWGGKWDKQELFNRAEIMIEKILKKRESNILLIDDLGDFLDGWDGKTARKNHDLPQNMNNIEAFDAGFEFRMMLADKLAPHFSEVHFHLVGEDNHGGDFPKILNRRCKDVIELKYPHMTVSLHDTFIEHYFMGKHCFIVCHGKDSEALKFGFKPKLDSKGKDKIEEYIRLHKIDPNEFFIKFCKGDSHLHLDDYSTSDEFDYLNYPAFSPSSKWVQMNFKRGKSGFVIENYKMDEQERGVYPKYFEWSS